ncbi:MAG: methionyl-tRNA formyltransferase [Cyclobacteriaceae bacterium]|nr:methionyl-tRNA formyltransferase [Cyclobacteriaceae bacterium]
MGTPEFAVESLKILVEHHFNVVAVITAPDKPQGRGQKLTFSPVKDYAVSRNIAVLQPAKLKSPEFLEELKKYRANLQVVVAFRMLPEVVWSMPEYGTFNLHASLLPQYRGAAPINWAIINGEKLTGVTTFFIKHEIDTGSIILQEEEAISDQDNVGMLYERLMKKGAGLVLKTVELIRDGSYTLKVQDESGGLQTAPKLFKETCEIDWAQPSKKITDFVRGLSPYPTAWTAFNGQTYKIYEVKVHEKAIAGEPGTVMADPDDGIFVKTGDGSVQVLDLQLQGKKRMSAGDFLRGNSI